MESSIQLFTDQAVLGLIGKRIREYRVNRNHTQARLAAEAGIGKRTLERIESGESVQLISIIRVMRSLEIMSNIEMLIPRISPSPIQQLERKGSTRKRASSSIRESRPKSEWTWGDES